MKKISMLHQHCARGAMAIGMATAPTSAWAQAEHTDSVQAPAPSPPQDSSTIIVTGIRSSLQKSAEIKRNAPQVLDVITAEDVGKLPDANVAEALQRVTGVQITRVFGEGQAVSVRGLQQVRVEVDGRTLLGWSSRLSPPENDQLGRSSGLDLVPSSLFGRLEVFKSPLASQAEGGLGGTVNLITPKPFDFRKTTVSLRADGTYSENAKKFEPGFAGLFSTRLAGGRIGILISGEYQKRTSVLQTLERNDFNDANYTSGGVTTVHETPVLLQYENFVVDRSRFGVDGSVQFQATPDWVITAEGLFSKIQTGRLQQQIGLRVPTSTNPVTNAVLQDNFVVAGTTGAGTLTTYGQQRDEPAISQLYSLNSKYDNGKLSIIADGYYSRGTFDQSIEIITLQNSKPVFGTFDFRAGAVPSLVLTTTGGAPFDATNAANWKLATNGVRANRLLGLLEEGTGKVDVAYRTGGGLTLSAGVRYTDLHSTSHAFRSQVTVPYSSVAPYINPSDAADFLPDINQDIPRSFLVPTANVDWIYNTAQAAQPNPDPNAASALLPNDQRDYDLTEKTTAGYVMVAADTELFGMPMKANVGLRVAHTSLSVDTNEVTSTGTSPVTDTNSY
ncbi:MAG TPA: TonB-dependent receptor, partial [Sphingomicrobium sp.]|nr:TonB-dependent receptor [Sphingomicrobium sp.]